MATATATAPNTRRTAKPTRTADQVDNGVPATFFAATAYYRQAFWARLDRPAVVAYRECNQMMSVRWSRALPGAKVATLRALRVAYPDVIPTDDGRALFVRATREAALGCIR